MEYQETLSLAVVNAVFRLSLTPLFIFLPAGTLHYWQGWLYLAVCVGLSIVFAVLLWYSDRALREQRLRVGPQAKGFIPPVPFVLFWYFTGISTIVLSALAYRWEGAALPPAVCLLGDGLIVLGSWVDWEVFRAERSPAATVDIDAPAVVVTTGPYALVRHPKSALWLIGSVTAPLALGSTWGLWTTLMMWPAMVWRVSRVDKQLLRELAGYDAYCRQVRYRLIPYVW